MKKQMNFNMPKMKSMEGSASSSSSIPDKAKEKFSSSLKKGMPSMKKKKKGSGMMKLLNEMS